MPLRREAQFLRDRARRLHEIAGVYQTALSQQLRAMAEELDELEREQPPTVPKKERPAVPRRARQQTAGFP
jgi:hypothetical protein